MSISNNYNQFNVNTSSINPGKEIQNSSIPLLKVWAGIKFDLTKFVEIQTPTALPSNISNRIAPTQHFLNSLAAGNLDFIKSDGDKQSYVRSYQDVMPVDNILESEHALLESHIPCYSAFNKVVFALQTFSKKVLTSPFIDATGAARDPKNICWVRNPFETPPCKNIVADVPSLLAKTHGHIVDNTATFSWQLLSCNPHLFGNVFFNSDESTVDYFFDDKSVMTPIFSEKIHQVLNNVSKNSDVKVKNEEDLINSLERSIELLDENRGILYQMMIPFNEVNLTTYVCQQTGVPDELHPDALQSLISLQYENPKMVDNYESMQTRILAQRWMNPTISADYRTHVYQGIDTTEAQLQKFDQTIESLVQQAFS